MQGIALGLQERRARDWAPATASVVYHSVERVPLCAAGSGSGTQCEPGFRMETRPQASLGKQVKTLVAKAVRKARDQVSSNGGLRQQFYKAVMHKT